MRDIFKRIIQENNTKSDALNVKNGLWDGCQPDLTLKLKGWVQHISATLTMPRPGPVYRSASRTQGLRLRAESEHICESIFLSTIFQFCYTVINSMDLII